MMGRRVFGVALALLAACSEGEPGVLASGIVSGQNQTVVAGTADLPEPVVQRIVRTADDRIVMYRVRQAPRRVMDFLVPPLYAQGQGQGGTVVNGSPVPGAVVCAEEGEDVKLIPFARCTNTDNNGQATFFFHVGSQRANTYRAEIRGTVDDEPAVFDTAVATVVAGAPDPDQYWPFAAMGSPAVLDAQAVVDEFSNAIPFRIVGDGRLTVVGDTAGTAAARTVTFTDALLDTAWYGPVEFRGVSDAIVARALYRVIIDNDKPGIFWVVFGSALSPEPPQ